MDERLIYERLKALSGGIDREQYRDISKAFEEVVRYNKKALEELRHQLDQELRDVSERFYIYGAVTEAGDAPIVNDFLFPMSREHASESIATIFCQCAREEMEEIFSNPHPLVVETDNGTREIIARIRPCQRYLEQIDLLKAVFYENGIYWRTPFLPYVYKFGDVYCDSFDRESSIRSIRFKNRELTVRHDLIPLWNVEAIKLKCTIFPVPAIDEQNYKHTLRLPFSQDGYVAVMDQTIKNVYFTGSTLELTAREKQQREFELYRIAVRRDINAPHYRLTANYRRMRHIDRQADHSMARLRTRAEISRIISSYEAGDAVELVGIDPGGTGRIKGRGDPYSYCPGAMEPLMLIFRVKEDSFILEDTVSFLIDEVQSYFPHLAITGDLAE